MMNCKQYLFKLTSGQLEEATFGERMHARLHLLTCHRCRKFTRNDATLDDILRAWRNHMQTPQEQDAEAQVPDAAHSKPPSSVR